MGLVFRVSLGILLHSWRSLVVEGPLFFFGGLGFFMPVLVFFQFFSQ